MLAAHNLFYVTNLVGGMIRAIERKTDGELINHTNDDEVVSINHHAKKIINNSGKDFKVEHGLSKPTDTVKYAIGDTKMKMELDWEPDVSLERSNQERVANRGNE
jgi:nucleoside-diphosphate-sugar epimerase